MRDNFRTLLTMAGKAPYSDSGSESLPGLISKSGSFLDVQNLDLFAIESWQVQHNKEFDAGHDVCFLRLFAVRLRPRFILV